MKWIGVAIVSLGLAGTAYLVGVHEHPSVARADEDPPVAGVHNSRLEGSYALDIQGEFMELGPGAFIGVMTFHPKGTLTSTFHGNIGGEFVNVAVDGLYTINSNDTGTITLFEAGVTPTFDIIFSSRRRRAVFVRTDIPLRPWVGHLDKQ